MFLVGLALLTSVAFAGLNGAVRTSPFASCRSRVETPDVVRPFPARCQAPRVDGDTRLKMESDAIAGPLQLAEATRLARKKIDDQLDLYIDSRARLLVCMDREDEECRARVTRLTDMLTTQAKRLRVLLAMSAPVPEGLDANTVDRIPHEIRLPAGLGGKYLAPLSADEKMDVRRARQKLIDQMRYPDGDVARDCTPGPEKTDPCRRYQTWLLNKKFEMHDAAAHVAEVLVHQLPLVTQVTEVPVTKEAARAILRRSQDVLRKWKNEVAQDYVDQPDTIVHRYPRVFESILRDHPEWCGSLDTAFRKAQARGELKDIAVTAAQAGTAIAGCWFTGGVVCSAAGTVWSAWHVTGAVREAGLTRERYQGLGAPVDDGSLLPYSDVKAASRDEIVALGGLAVSSTFLTRSVSKALDPAKLPSRPWSQQLEAAMDPDKLDMKKTETIIFKAGRKVDRAVHRNANEVTFDRRTQIQDVTSPLGELESSLAEMYSPVP